MADRPILFSAPMVRALLDGRKTQTRRIVTGVPERPFANCHPHNIPRHGSPYLDSYCSEPRTVANPRGMSTEWCWWQVDDRQSGQSFKVKYKPGDRLWVRETWAVGNIYDGVPPRDINPDGKPNWCGIRYAATDQRLGIKDRVSIHMPRWASRLTLTVTDVRVQRLQDISEEDARAEGVEPIVDHGVGNQHLHRIAFDQLWERIHGDGATYANPWVAAYTFTVERRNIDEVSHD